MKKVVILTVVAIMASAVAAMAGARDNVIIEKGDQCGAYGGDQIYITNTGDLPVKATIKISQYKHGSLVRTDFDKEIVEPGESIYLGCNGETFDTGGGKLHFEYSITGAYYVK